MGTLPSNPGQYANTYTPMVQTYAIRQADVKILSQYIISDTFTGAITDILGNPVDNIVSLRVFPIDITRAVIVPTSYIQVRINKANVPGLTAYRLLRPANMLPFGTITVPQYYASYLDFSPYTKIQIYLPYLGYRDLDPAEVIGKEITLKYAIDFNTGTFTAFLTTTDKTILIESGTMGIDIPVAGGQNVQIAKNLLLLAAGAVTSVASGNPLGTAAGVAGVAAGAFQALDVNPKRSGNIDPNTNLYAPDVPYLLISRPVRYTPPDYGHYYGYPTARTKILGDLSGYTRVARVHVEGMTGATENERTEVENLLKTGVIL